MNLLRLNSQITADELAQIGLDWCDGGYISPELVQVSFDEAEEYYAAALRCYEMYCAAAEHIIANDLFFEMGIPFNLVEMIKETWANDVHWHIYGRFDFAGGLDGEPIKLLEFNANTPTALLETAFIQFEQMRREGMDTQAQFNTIHQALIDNFKRLLCGEGDIEQIGEIPYKILFTCVRDAEEVMTMKFLQAAAKEAGFCTEFAYIDEVEFSLSDGAVYEQQRYEYVFSLLPWEIIATEEPELCNLLSEMIAEHLIIALNPAYTLLFQSKGILKILHELFPDEPLILRADTAPLSGCAQVAKPFFGREGANVTISNAAGEVVTKSNGDFSDGKFIYQEFATLNQHEGRNYQAGVFFAYEPCGLGFRRSSGIIDNRAGFVGHYLKG